VWLVHYDGDVHPSKSAAHHLTVVDGSTRDAPPRKKQTRVPRNEPLLQSKHPQKKQRVEAHQQAVWKNLLSMRCISRGMGAGAHVYTKMRTVEGKAKHLVVSERVTRVAPVQWQSGGMPSKTYRWLSWHVFLAMSSDSQRVRHRQAITGSKRLSLQRLLLG
jgi:hypothetical protein